VSAPPPTAGASGGGSEGLGIRRAVLIFLAAAVLRAGYGGFLLARAADPAALTFPDEQQYWLMAESLSDGRGMVDELGFRATRMPLYPGLLSLFAAAGGGGVVAARAAHWLIGAAGAVLVGLLGARLGGGRVGLAAGLLVAFDPALVGLSSLLLTETLHVAVLAALWWVGWPLLERRPGFRGGRWLAVGVLASLNVYVRPSIAGLVLLWLGLLFVRRPTRRDLAGVACAGGVVVLSLVPWAARNQRVTGHWCWLTHRLGISLYDGVGPQATGAGDLGDVKAMPAVAGLDEVAWNEWFLDHAWQAMRDDPRRTLRLAGTKLARTWSPVLHADEYSSPWIRLIFGGWSVSFFGLALGGVVLLRCRPAVWIALLLPAAYVALLHSLFVGSVRYRVTATPTLAVLAGWAVIALWQRRRRQPEAQV